MFYIWNPKNPESLAHIATDRGSVCKMENNGQVIKAFTASGEEPPKGRGICKICSGDSRQQKQSAHFEKRKAKRLNQEFNRRWKESLVPDTSW